MTPNFAERFHGMYGNLIAGANMKWYKSSGKILARFSQS